MKTLGLFALILAAMLIHPPTVNAGEAGAGGIEGKVTVPDSAWTVAVVEVREVKGEVWVLSQLSRDPEVMGAQVITELKIVAPVVTGMPVKHFILGKTWGWANEEPHRFITAEAERKEFDKVFLSGKLLHPAKP